MARKRKNTMFSSSWLMDTFGNSKNHETKKIGSNVIDICVHKLNDEAFEEGGAVRMIAHVVVDSDFKVRLCGVKTDKDGVHYRLSTNVTTC